MSRSTNAVPNITRRLHCKSELGIGKQLVGLGTDAFGNWDRKGRINFSLAHHRSIYSLLFQNISQTLFQVFDQVFSILESDVQPHDAVSIVRTACGPVEVVSHCKTGHSAPAIADFKQ